MSAWPDGNLRAPGGREAAEAPAEDGPREDEYEVLTGDSILSFFDRIGHAVPAPAVRRPSAADFERVECILNGYVGGAERLYADEMAALERVLEAAREASCAARAVLVARVQREWAAENPGREVVVSFEDASKPPAPAVERPSNEWICKCGHRRYPAAGEALPPACNICGREMRQTVERPSEGDFERTAELARYMKSHALRPGDGDVVDRVLRAAREAERLRKENAAQAQWIKEIHDEPVAAQEKWSRESMAKIRADLGLDESETARLRERVAVLEAALRKIVNMDYRGPEPAESRIARAALAAGKGEE